jgi:hypothetical protein
MNRDEREQLVRFLEQLAQAQAVRKDEEADALIRSTCARQADAAYLLVQRAMLLEQAVQNSRSEIARLQSELAQARNPLTATHANPGFIDANSWGNSPAAPTTSAPSLAPAPSALPAASARGSGMLGTIATTAAGVVAGNFLYQGIEHLLSKPHTPSALTNSANDSAAAAYPQDDGVADIFDTSSVDDYIASDDTA